MDNRHRTDGGRQDIGGKIRKMPERDGHGEAEDAKQTLERLSEELDHSLMIDALIISDLFRTAAEAAVFLPNMKLHTDLFSVEVDDSSILVKVDRPKKEDKFMMDFTNEFHSSQARDPGYEEDDWEMDDEEEWDYEEC